jgi:hypothetical protein
LFVAFYPTDKEAEIQAKREAGKSWGRGKKQAPQPDSKKPADSSAISSADSSAMTELERKGIGREIEEETPFSGNPEDKEKTRELQNDAVVLSTTFLKDIHKANGTIPTRSDPKLTCAIREIIGNLGYEETRMFLVKILAGYSKYRAKMEKPIEFKWLYSSLDDIHNLLTCIHRRETGNQEANLTELVL